MSALPDISDAALSNLKPAEARPGRRKIFLFCFIYLAYCGLNEFIIYHVNNLAGLILYFVLLLGLIITGTLIRRHDQRNFLLASGLVPLIRIVSLVTPTAEISLIYWYIFIAIPTLIGIIAVMRATRLGFEDIGLVMNDPTLQVLVAVEGFILGAFGYYFLRPSALAGGLSVPLTLSPALILMVSTGFVEEMAFRGVMQRAAGILGQGDWVFIAMVYAVLQIGHGSAIFGLITFLVSLFFGWIVKKSGSIVGVCLAHGFFNIGLFLVFPFVFPF